VNSNFTIGRTHRTANDEFLFGLTAYNTVWNAKLSTSHMAALNRGVYPMFVSSHKPIGHFPLHGNDSPEADYSGGGALLTLTGTTKSTTNPPIQLLSRYV